MPTSSDGSVVSPVVLSLATTAELQTFQDLFEHVLDGADNKSSQTGRTRNNSRRAALEAYRDLPTLHPWKFYERMHRIRTVAQQTSSTITYDHTGGANERMVTLASGTWPTNAQLYRLRISERDYEIEERVSNTVLTLTEDSNPGADVAAGTSYVLHRARYTLPDGFRKLASSVVSRSLNRELTYMQPDELLRIDLLNYEAPAQPQRFTLINSVDEYGLMEIELSPSPSTADFLDFVYERTPRRLRLFGGNPQYNTGTVSVSGTTVTGSGTTFTSEMVGAILRLSSSATAATGFYGDNPYAEQAVVSAVASATSLTLESSPTGTYSGVGYSISDPLDVSAQMLTCLEMLAELKFMRLNRHDPKLYEQRNAVFTRALLEAMVSDRRHRDILSANIGFEDIESSVGTVDVNPD